MSEFKSHPKWKYHKTEKPKIVHTSEAEKEIGDEWKDSPAEHGVETYPAAPAQDLEVKSEDIESSPSEAPAKKKGKK